MSRIRQFISAMSELERAEVALGLMYVVDDGYKAFAVPGENLDYWREHDWFGRKDVGLHRTLPKDYRELEVLDLKTLDLSNLLMYALDCYEKHRADPWYLLMREFSEREHAG